MKIDKLNSRKSKKPRFLSRLIKKLGQKKNSNKISGHINKKNKIYFSGRSNYGQKETKVFKPKNLDLVKEKMKNRTFGQIFKKNKKLKFGTENFAKINKNELNLQQYIYKIIKLFAIKYKIVDRINFLIAITIIISSISFFLYLNFFDTYFLVKKYEIEFSDNSYISEKNIKMIINEIKTQRFLGAIPNNQFWFLSEKNITSIAKDVYPEITSVKIKEKKWPDTAVLEISTEPMLVTLGVKINNKKEYWRISKNGRILDKDEANLNKNIININSPIRISKVGYNKTTFGAYSFENKELQKERFWFSFNAWQWLEEMNVSYIKTSLPSLSDYDTDVVIYTENQTKLLFDVTAMSQKTQQERLDTIFKHTSIGQKEKQGKLAYIDFRIPKKIYWCEKGSSCD